MRGAAWLATACALVLAALVHATHSGGAEAPPPSDLGQAGGGAAPALPAPALPAPALPAPALPGPTLLVPALPAPLPTHIPVAPPNYELLDAGSDRPIRVLPAQNPNRRAIVYLHGYCGDVNAVGAFTSAAAVHGALIALLGDQPCKDKPGRFKWSRDTHALDQRIQRAIRLVNRAHNWDLDVRDVTLFGYSQGAVRAEALAGYYAKRYPRVILGGPPRRPKPEHFKRVRAIAVFGGELEDTHDMLGGAQDLAAGGLQARFFLLPGVDHGDFGGELAGNLALSEILDFLSSPPGPEPSIEPAAPEKIAR